MEEVLDNDLKNLDVKAPVITKDSAIFSFEGTTEETKGYAGGAIGVNQVKNQFKLVVGVWETL
jgi:hypothetical protein